MRSDRATCAICMDTLFNKLDDLDEIVPIASSDCGHVFHEECLHQWFKSQENTYLDTERQHGDYRDSSPHPSEAPTECPTCRQECFLTEDGKYDTKRLYINWGEQDGSSMAGSSPVRATPTQTRRGTGPSEVMLLARRAKALGAEVGDMSADSQPEDIKGLQRRAEGLKRDLEDLKGVEGIRRYVGGLATALNKLSTNLETNPLSAELRMQLAAQEHKVAEHERRLRDMVDRFLPEQIAAAKRQERKEADRRHEKLQKEADTLSRAVQEQKVLRTSVTKTYNAKLEDLEGRLAIAEENAQKERKCRVSLEADLREQTKQLRLLQAKAKSRKDLKTELSDAKAELAKLRSENEQLSKRMGSARPDRHTTHSDTPSPYKRPRLSDTDIDNNFEIQQYSQLRSSLPPHDAENEISIQELSPTTFSQLTRPTAKRRTEALDPADESLLIDMESFDRSHAALGPLDLLESPGERLANRAASRTAPRGTTTARSFTSDQFAAPSRRIDNVRAPTASSSKYFAGSATSSESRTNPFSSTKAETENRKKLPSEVIVPASSDIEDEHPPRPALAQRGAITNIPRESAGRDDRRLDNAKRPSSWQPNPTKPIKRPSGQQGIAAALGLVDKNGRPVKGLAIGAKAGRRA